MPQRLIINVGQQSAFSRIETHVFDSSPVNVGSGPECGLRLSGPGILRNHGLIFFGPSSIRYFDLAANMAAPTPPTELACELGRVVRVGPFDLAACLEDARPAIGAPVNIQPELPCAALSRGLVEVVTSVMSTIRAVPTSEADLLAGFTVRAITVLDALADALAELHPDRLRSWACLNGMGSAPAPLDVSEVVECLVDPAAWEARFHHLRVRLVDFVRWESLAMATAGSA